MFASQLLRILHTIPSDMKYENCVYDPAEQNMTVKENQNVTFYGSKSFGKEAESLDNGNQEICLLNGSRMGSVPLAFEVNGRNEIWNAKFVNDYSKDNESSTGDSPKKKEQNRHSYHLSGQDADSDSLPSGKDEDKLWRSPEFECSTLVKEPTHCIEDEFQDSGHPSISASDLIESDSKFSTDKNTLGFELPELIVCYKETDYQVVKDIHGDERIPMEESISIKNRNGNQSFLSSSQSPADGSHCKATGGVGMECFISDGLTASSLENTTGVGGSEYGSKEETNGKLLAQGISKSPPESTLVKDTLMDCDLTDLMWTVEAKSGVTGKIENGSSKEESLVVSTLPIQEFGTRSFLRSFLNALDIDGYKTVSSNEMPSGKAVYESSAEAEPKEDVHSKNTLYNSEVESGNILFSFDSPLSVAAGSSSGITENRNQQSDELGGLHNHKNANADNLSDTRQVQSNSTKENKNENFHEQLLNITSQFSVPSQVQCSSSKDGCHENGCEQSPDQKDGTSDDLSTDDRVQFASSKSQGSTNPNGQVVEPFFPKHERGCSSGNISVVSQMQYDGESSFSAAGLVTYSGSIAYSGSLSHRSDGSTTSTRSFAFPVLQSEWNRSPVRMEKADRRHFQKHKGWRSGLFCCRF